jgi:hypothetical protein
MPPEGKIYVVIVLHEGDAAWTVTATQAVLISSAAGVGVWQIDVQGSGVWAMALVDAPGSDGGVDAAAPVIPDASAPSADGAAEAVDAGTTGGVDAIVAQPSKPRLWASVTVGGAGTGDLYGYAVEQLAVDATGPTPVADYTGLAQGLYHFVFDAFGDVWGENGGGGMSRQAPPAAGSSAFPAAMAAAALSKSTVGQIFALDPAGNLWTQTNFGVCRWDKATLNAPMTSDITTSITVSATTVAFAFNAASDLIAEDLQSIRRWAASQLTGTGTITDPATRTLTFPAYSQCKWMVMDAGGNAWLIDCPSNVLMRKLTAAQLAGSGTSAATFTSFNVDAAALPNPASPTLTFDDAGNAWIAAGGGKIVEIPAADLAVDSPGQTVVLQPKLTIRAPANSNVTFRSLLWR